jgi:hypothetical protein
MRNFKEIMLGFAEGDLDVLGRKIVRCAELVREQNKLTDLESQVVGVFEKFGELLSCEEKEVGPKIVCKHVQGTVVQRFNAETGELLQQEFKPESYHFTDLYGSECEEDYDFEEEVDLTQPSEREESEFNG